MKLLVSNDDGYLAAGIGALVKALAGAGHEVYVAAPHRQRSAASRSMTLHEPLRAERVTLPAAPDVPAYAVSGTPVDCVRLALGNLFPAPDAVLSGVNHGANLGTDTLYSGTVAAAHEAGFRHQRPGGTGAQEFNMRGQAHDAMVLSRIGGAAEGNVRQRKDGAAVGHAHAVDVVAGQRHADAGVILARFFDGDIEKPHQLVVFGDKIIHEILLVA